jgi:hypothetical protein
MLKNIAIFTTVEIDRNTVIRDGSKIKGNLRIGYRSKTLLNLPVGLRVKGDINLYYEQDLVSLPEGLVVLHDIDLRGCMELKYIPTDAIIGGEIHYDGNTYEKTVDVLKKRFKGKVIYDND